MSRPDIHYELIFRRIFLNPPNSPNFFGDPVGAATPEKNPMKGLIRVLPLGARDISLAGERITPRYCARSPGLFLQRKVFRPTIGQNPAPSRRRARLGGVRR